MSLTETRPTILLQPSDLVSHNLINTGVGGGEGKGKLLDVADFGDELLPFPSPSPSPKRLPCMHK